MYCTCNVVLNLYSTVFPCLNAGCLKLKKNKKLNFCRVQSHASLSITLPFQLLYHSGMLDNESAFIRIDRPGVYLGEAFNRGNTVYAYAHPISFLLQSILQLHAACKLEKKTWWMILINLS